MDSGGGGVQSEGCLGSLLRSMLESKSPGFCFAVSQSSCLTSQQHKRKGLHPKCSMYFCGKQIGISCFSHFSLKFNPSVSESEDGAEGKKGNKIWESHKLLLLPILLRGKLYLLPEEPLPHTSLFPLLAPLPSTGAAAMVARHGC